MDGEDCGGVYGELRLDGMGVDAKCFRVAVGEDRLEAVPPHAVSGGVERKTRKDYFTLEIQRAQSEYESCRTTGDGNTMGDVEIFRGGVFEFASECCVGQLTAAQDFAHVAEEFIIRKAFRRNDR